MKGEVGGEGNQFDDFVKELRKGSGGSGASRQRPRADEPCKPTPRVG